MIIERLLDDMSRQQTDKQMSDLRAAVEVFVQGIQARGGYMPACATVLRIIADELADRFPDDTNGGRAESPGSPEPQSS